MVQELLNITFKNFTYRNITIDNSLIITKDITDTDIIKNYCYFINEQLLNGIIALIIIFLLIELLSLSIFLIKNNKKEKVRNFFNDLRAMNYYIASSFLLAQMAYVLSYKGYISLFAMAIAKFILIALLLIISFGLYRLGYIDKFMRFVRYHDKKPKSETFK